MKGFIYAFLFLAFAVLSCDDCDNCEPFTEEPNLSVRFYNLADSSRKVIIIYSVNQTLARNFRHFNDTTYSFKFPLDMNNDSSTFNLIYRDTTDIENYYSNKLTVYYTREFVQRDDNYVVVACHITDFSTDFEQSNLECKESETNQCISNDAKASLYN